MAKAVEKRQRRVVVVLPAYNEARNLPPLLAEMAALAAGEPGLSLQVVVVDDGSTDGTAQAARAAARGVAVEVVAHPRNLGLAAAFRTGMLEALKRLEPAGGEGRCGEEGGEEGGEVVVAMDADASHLPAQIPAMLRRLDQGADVVIASRYRRGARVEGVPAHRRLLSLGMGILFKAIAPVRGVRDYSCGFRAYRASFLSKAHRRQGDALFAQEGFACMVGIMLRLAQEGARFAEVPICLRYDRKAGASKMKLGVTVARTLRLLARERVARVRR